MDKIIHVRKMWVMGLRGLESPAHGLSRLRMLFALNQTIDDLISARNARRPLQREIRIGR